MAYDSTGVIHSLPFAWRVTRYDPVFRDSRGAYTMDTWTSIADVGRVFEDRTLSIEEYERVETAYAETVLAFAREVGTTHVQVREFPEYDDEPYKMGAVIPIGDVPEIVRAMLREEAHCMLEAPTNDFYVHVGYDLYMYVGATCPCPKAVAFAERLGLFIDPNWPSPYLPEGEDE